MTLPIQPIGSADLADQILLQSPEYNSGGARTLWIYYGGAWFNPTRYFTEGPLADFYSGYYIDVLSDGGGAGTGVGVDSGSLTTQLIAPDYRWVAGWQSNPSRIEGPLDLQFDADDLINGLSGTDQIFSGPGDDQIYLNGGNDWGLGGDGNDMIRGGAGNDLLCGDWTNVPVYFTLRQSQVEMRVTPAAISNTEISNFSIPAASSSARTMHFDADGTYVQGEPGGDDQLFGDEGSDTLYGGPGNDQFDVARAARAGRTGSPAATARTCST